MYCLLFLELIAFREMREKEQCHLILSRIINEDFAKNALCNSEVISEDTPQVSKSSNFVIRRKCKSCLKS